MAEQATDNIHELDIRLVVPDGLTTRYVNYVMVQAGEHDFYLNFCEVVPPAITGTPEEIKDKAKRLKYINATCVARIAIAKNLMPKLLEAMGTIGIIKDVNQAMILKTKSSTELVASGKTGK